MEDPADRQAAAHGGVGAGVAKDVGAAADAANGARTTTTSSCGSSLKLTASVAEETAPTPAPAAGCFLPRTVTQQQSSNAAGHAGGRGTGGTWHEVVEPLCDSAATGGVDSAGDDGGRVAAVRERSKVRLYVRNRLLCCGNWLAKYTKHVPMMVSFTFRASMSQNNGRNFACAAYVTFLLPCCWPG